MTSHRRERHLEHLTGAGHLIIGGARVAAIRYTVDVYQEIVVVRFSSRVEMLGGREDVVISEATIIAGSIPFPAGDGRLVLEDGRWIRVAVHADAPRVRLQPLGDIEGP